MHGLPSHENEKMPCGYYCGGGQHVDIIYLAPWLIAASGADLLGTVRQAWATLGNQHVAELCALRAAPEALDARTQYPGCAARRPGVTVPYLVTYRVLSPAC